jgi:hypothetical protein
VRRRLAIEAQRSQLELGNIRIGEKREGKSGAKYPASLDTYRFTSPHKQALEAVAKVYGGQVRPWEGNPGQWELVTESNELRVLIRPDASISEAFEQWSAGGCTHRCDGEVCEWARKIEPPPSDPKAPRHELVQVPCMCDPDDRDCKLVTRFRVILSNVPLQGGWRFNTQSKIFNAQTQGAIDMLETFGLGSKPFYGRLTLTMRETHSLTKGKSRFPIVELTQDLDPPNYPAIMMAAMPSLAPAPAPPQALEPSPQALPQGNEDVKRDCLETMRANHMLSPDSAPFVEEFKRACKAKGRFWAEAFLELFPSVGPDWRKLIEAAGRLA